MDPENPRVGGTDVTNDNGELYVARAFANYVSDRQCTFVYTGYERVIVRTNRGKKIT